MSMFPNQMERVELDLVQQGFTTIVGCDEAGRGPLAGPVVAAAVLFRDCEAIWSCHDSKSLTRLQREYLLMGLEQNVKFAYSIVEPDEIDRVNIRVASLTAMSRAVKKVSANAQVILVDGRDRLPDWSQSRAIIKGDALVATIGAASIVAKVTRDRIMRDYAKQYPLFGFEKHFGYPTEQHREAIKKLGTCPIHRRSFRGVREYLENF